ncbi:glycosyltransferase family 4 protein [Agrobacterium cavarae]|uniref:glycosyltransferase family 4 protein n=1 Tax=Agrobacterium cavarae TaxID=2528239 RepID=UPI003FD5B458
MRRKILIVSRSTPFHRLGGMEVVLWDLAKEFSRLGHETTVLTTSLPQHGALDPAEIGDIKLVCLPCASGRYSFRWWVQSRRYFKNCLTADTDVVLSVSAGAFGLSRKQSKAVFVAQLHGTAWGEFISKLRQRRLVPLITSLRNLLWIARDVRYRIFDVLTFVGPAVYDEAIRAPMSLVLGSGPRQIITNGIDQRQFSFKSQDRQSIRAALSYGDDDKIVLCSSRLHYQKGIMEALRAFRLAAVTDARLRMMILGDGPARASIEQFIASYHLQGIVKLQGRIPRNELPAYLSASDLFLFTTKRVEGLPMNVLEALASGLPSVISNSINHPDFNAVGVDPDDEASVAAAISSVAIDPDRISRLKERYTLEFSAHEYLRLFASISNGAK